MKQKHIQKKFQPLVELIGLSEGKVFASIGASSGANDVMLSTLVKDVTFYIQDIDKDCLNQQELDKILDYYSRQSKQNLVQKNYFEIIYGDENKTNLPNDIFDIIFTNGTFHVFLFQEGILADIYKKLKPNGYFFIRESIARDGKLEYCPDEKCEHKRLFYESEIIKMLENHNFKFIKKYDDFLGYPIFKFQKK